jgi:hypothetical protein
VEVTFTCDRQAFINLAVANGRLRTKEFLFS